FSQVVFFDVYVSSFHLHSTFLMVVYCMVPKFRDVEITEFMTGFTVQSYTAQASSMNIYIPALMFDKTGGTNTSTISLSGNILVSRETIRIPSSLTDHNYITVKVSDLFRAT